MKRLLIFAGGVLAGALIFVSAIAAERQGRPLPAWASALLTAQFPKAELVRADREGDDDEIRYEARLKRTDDGRRIDVDLTEEAGITEIDEELKQDQLPERVTKALSRAFPKAQIRQAEKNTDIRTAYSIEIVSEGKKREVRISPRGRILEIEKRD